MDLDQLVGKVKEFIYLLEDLTSDQVKGLGVEELKAFLQEQLRTLTTWGGSDRTAASGLMRKPRFFILQQIFWRNTFRPWMHCVNQSACAAMATSLDRIKNEGYDMSLK